MDGFYGEHDSGIAREQWSSGMKKAVGYVEKNSNSEDDKVIYAHGVQRDRSMPRKHLAGIILPTLIVLGIFLFPFFRGLDDKNAKLLVGAMAIVFLGIPLILNIFLMIQRGRYTYTVTNAHMIFYKGSFHKESRWLSLSPSTRTEYDGQSLVIDSGGQVKGKRGEVRLLTLEGLSEEEAEKIISAVDQAIRGIWGL